MIKTTTKHFELFKDECKKWIDKLELNQYDVVYSWENLSPSKIDGARCIATAHYTVNISFDTELDDENYPILNNEIIKGMARHEIMHLLISRLAINAYSRFINKNELDEAEEELVRKLTRIIK